jgi:metallo-beta-lactamase class B
VNGLEKLGLDPRDIRYVIVSHAHPDHVGGAKYLQDAYGARIVMSVEEWAYMHAAPLRGAPPPFPREDIAVRDGYTITLGDTSIDLYFTPGHTPGTLSSVFPVRDGDNVHYVGYLGGSGIPQTPAGIVQFMASADRFARVDSRVDTYVSNHPMVDGTLLKLEALNRRERSDPHPFVFGNAGFKESLSVLHDCAGEMLERRLAAPPPAMGMGMGR